MAEARVFFVERLRMVGRGNGGVCETMKYDSFEECRQAVNCKVIQRFLITYLLVACYFLKLVFHSLAG